MQRIASGQPRLDEVFGGGLPANAINLIAGLPGTGKTMLAQLYAFTNATEEHPAVYLTTAAEPLEKVIRYGQELAFFDRQALGRRIFYENLGGLLRTAAWTRRSAASWRCCANGGPACWSSTVSSPWRTSRRQASSGGSWSPWPDV